MNTPLSERRVAIAELTLGEELQPRCRMDRNLIEHYRQLLLDGVELPPVVVFDDGARRWLADGFHRVRAHQALGRANIACRVYLGTRLDAIRFSLSANATHGKPRTRGDLIRAYASAKHHGLVTPGDAQAVRTLLNCSSAWAFKLTEADRRHGKAERLQRVRQLRAAGRSLSEIAAELGLKRSTVGNLLRQERASPYRSIARRLDADYLIRQPDGREQRVAQADLNRHQWLLIEERLYARIKPLEEQLAALQAIRPLLDPVWATNPQLSLETVCRLVFTPHERTPSSSSPAWLQEDTQ